MEWRAFLLQPDTPPEGRPHPIPKEQRAQRSAPLKAMAAEAGLPIVDHDWIPNSRPALEASEYARSQGRFDEFHRAVFHAHFAEARDIGKPEVLADIARSVGLDPDGLLAALENREFAAFVDEDVQLAAELGLTGVPAFILGNRAIVGAQPYEVFEQVMSLLGAQKKHSTAEADGE